MGAENGFLGWWPLRWISLKSGRRIAWTILCVVFLALCFKGFLYSDLRLSDFAGYYGSSRMVVSDTPLSFLYDDEAFQKWLRDLGINEPTIVFYVNPPPVSLLVLPVAWMDPFDAKLVWNCLNLAGLAMVFILARRIFRTRDEKVASLALFGLIFCTIPLLQNLQRGQVYPLLLLLVTILWHAYQNRTPWVFAFALTALFLVKYFGWMFLPLLFVEGRWKELGSTVAVLAAAGLGSILFFGPETYHQHFVRFAAAIDSMDFALTGLPSVPALLGSLFVGHPVWNPVPVAHVPWLAAALTVTTLLAFLLMTLFGARTVQPEGDGRRFMCLLILSVVFTPLAADHHFLLVSIPLFFFLRSDVHVGTTGRWPLLVVLMLYLTLGWFPRLPAGEYDGWSKLLCFPRLYGALTAWFVLLMPCRDPTGRHNG